MNKEDRPNTAETTVETSDDITCGQCGKLNGNEQVGTSWICTDCKVSEALSEEE